MLQNHGLVFFFVVVAEINNKKQAMAAKTLIKAILKEKGFVCVHSIISGKAARALEAVPTSHLQSEAERKESVPSEFRTQTQALVPPSVEGSLHINSCNQDSPSKTSPLGKLV